MSMSMVNHVFWKELTEQVGLHCYAVITYPDQLVLEPPLEKILDSPMTTTTFHIWKPKANFRVIRKRQFAIPSFHQKCRPGAFPPALPLSGPCWQNCEKYIWNNLLWGQILNAVHIQPPLTLVVGYFSITLQHWMNIR